MFIFRKNFCLSWPAWWTPCASLVTHLSLNALLSSLLKINGKEFLLTPFSVQNIDMLKDHVEAFFFFNIKLNLSDIPQLLTKKTVSSTNDRRSCSSCLFRQPEYQTCHHDQIFPEMEYSSWFKKARAVCCMHGWKNCGTLIPASTRFV